jgi:excisionase family DNA binding protein
MANAHAAIDAVLDEHEAVLAQAAQRCLMAALDHSRADTIRLVAEGDTTQTVVELSPKTLRFVADLLGMLAQRQPVALLPQKLELSTQEAAHVLNVSRPFVVKEIEAGRLPCRKVGRHRRVMLEDLLAYKQAARAASEAALQALADQAQELNMGY